MDGVWFRGSQNDKQALMSRTLEIVSIALACVAVLALLVALWLATSSPPVVIAVSAGIVLFGAFGASNLGAVLWYGVAGTIERARRIEDDAPTLRADDHDRPP